MQYLKGLVIIKTTTKIGTDLVTGTNLMGNIPRSMNHPMQIILADQQKFNLHTETPSVRLF